MSVMEGGGRKRPLSATHQILNTVFHEQDSEGAIHHGVSMAGKAVTCGNRTRERFATSPQAFFPSFVSTLGMDVGDLSSPAERMPRQNNRATADVLGHHLDDAGEIAVLKQQANVVITLPSGESDGMGMGTSSIMTAAMLGVTESNGNQMTSATARIAANAAADVKTFEGEGDSPYCMTACDESGCLSNCEENSRSAVGRHELQMISDNIRFLSPCGLSMCFTSETSAEDEEANCHGPDMTKVASNLGGPTHHGHHLNPVVQKPTRWQMGWPASGLASSTSSCGGQQGSSEASGMQEPLTSLLHDDSDDEDYAAPGVSDGDTFPPVSFLGSSDLMGVDSPVRSECSDGKPGMFRVPSSQSGLTMANAASGTMRNTQSCSQPMPGNNSNTIIDDAVNVISDQSLGFPDNQDKLDHILLSHRRHMHVHVSSDSQWLSGSSGGVGDQAKWYSCEPKTGMAARTDNNRMADPTAPATMPKLKKQRMEGPGQCQLQSEKGPNNGDLGIDRAAIDSSCAWKNSVNSHFMPMSSSLGAADATRLETEGNVQSEMQSGARMEKLQSEAFRSGQKTNLQLQTVLPRPRDCEAMSGGGMDTHEISASLQFTSGLPEMHKRAGTCVPVTACRMYNPASNSGPKLATMGGPPCVKIVDGPANNTLSSSPVAGIQSCTLGNTDAPKSCIDETQMWTPVSSVPCSSSTEDMYRNSVCHPVASMMTVSTSMPMLTATTSLPSTTRGMLVAIGAKTTQATSATVTCSSVGGRSTSLGILSTGHKMDRAPLNKRPPLSPSTMDIPQCLKASLDSTAVCHTSLPLGVSTGLFGSEAQCEDMEAQQGSGMECGWSSRGMEKNGKICKIEDCGKGARGSSGLCIAHGGGRRCESQGCKKGAEGRTAYCKAHGGGRRCQREDCKKSAEGKTQFCIAHGGGRRCGYEGCERSARGSSGYCIRHGGGKRCSVEECNRSAEGHSGLCISHGGGRRCQYPNCTKGAQGSTPYCKAHGGGKRCTALGCNKGAEGKTPLCKAHGGGKRCKFGGGGKCTRSVHGGTDFCVAHGGGKRCAEVGCTKSARGKTAFCVRHGGGKRCQEQGCGKSAQGSTNFCKAHGGGKRCTWGELSGSDPCDRFARGRTGLCSAHTAVQKDGHLAFTPHTLASHGLVMPDPVPAVGVNPSSAPFAPSLLPNTMPMSATGSWTHGLQLPAASGQSNGAYGLSSLMSEAVNTFSPLSSVPNMAAGGPARRRVSPGLVDGAGRVFMENIGSITGLTAGSQLFMCMPLSSIVSGNVMTDTVPLPTAMPAGMNGGPIGTCAPPLSLLSPTGGIIDSLRARANNTTGANCAILRRRFSAAD